MNFQIGEPNYSQRKKRIDSLTQYNWEESFTPVSGLTINSRQAKVMLQHLGDSTQNLRTNWISDMQGQSSSHALFRLIIVQTFFQEFKKQNNNVIHISHLERPPAFHAFTIKSLRAAEHACTVFIPLQLYIFPPRLYNAQTDWYQTCTSI